MTGNPTHPFNTAPILLGSRRNKSAGWSKGHPTTTKSMLPNTENAVKGIVTERPHRLLGMTDGADHGDSAGLLGNRLIARLGSGRVGPQSGIKSLVCRRYARSVGEFADSRGSQDKQQRSLAGYWPLGCLNYGVVGL